MTTRTRTHHPINFSPFANNVLDYVGRPGLVMPNGSRVEISRSGMSFVITITPWPTDDPDSGSSMRATVYATQDNTQASYYLNVRQVGIKE